MPKVSVIIPVYNAMSYIDKTMESVLSQTYTDFEVIVVNDDSTDGIEKWCEEIKDTRVKYIHQKKQGLAAAKNTGIVNSQGEYIAFLNVGDIWSPTKLEKQVNVFAESREISFVYTWVACINSQGNFTEKVFKHQDEGHVWRRLTQHNIIESASAAMVRRSCFDKVGFFDKDLNPLVEDWDMWLRISICHIFQVIREPLVYSRQLPAYASKSYEAMANSYHKVIEKAFASTSPGLLYLKQRSYASAYIILAWKALQNQEPDYDKAVEFRERAAFYYPKIYFEEEYIRLSFAIASQTSLGKKVLSLVNILRNRG